MTLKYIQPPKPAEEKTVKGFNMHVHVFSSKGGELEGTVALLNSETLDRISQRALSDRELLELKAGFESVQQNEFTALGVEVVEDEVAEVTPAEVPIFKPPIEEAPKDAEGAGK